jgi:hypothetical protein
MQSPRIKAKQRDAVELGVRLPPHHRGGDLDDEHFREKLDLRAKQMATVSDGAVLLESDGAVDVRLYLVAVRVTAGWFIGLCW